MNYEYELGFLIYGCSFCFIPINMVRIWLFIIFLLCFCFCLGLILIFNSSFLVFFPHCIQISLGSLNFIPNCSLSSCLATEKAGRKSTKNSNFWIDRYCMFLFIYFCFVMVTCIWELESRLISLVVLRFQYILQFLCFEMHSLLNWETVIGTPMCYWLIVFENHNLILQVIDYMVLTHIVEQKD